MSLRKIWILLSPNIRTDGSEVTNVVVFSKYFPTSEKRAKTYSSNSYVPIPGDEEFCEELLVELGWKSNHAEFDPLHDSCKKYVRKPVFSVSTKKGVLWPIIVLEQYGLLFCCLPLVEQPILEEKPPLICISSIAVGFNFLTAVAEYVGASRHSEETLLDLHLFLNQAAPFGRPIHTSPRVVSQLLSGRTITSLSESKQPAWKPLPHKGKSQIQFTITEFVRAVHYDSSNHADVGELYGTITCRSELEGFSRDVAISVIPQANQDALFIPPDNVITHACVQICDIGSEKGSGMGRRGSGLPTYRASQIRFTPGLDTFPLCHYHNKLDERALPVSTFYQVKHDHDSAQILVQLKLNSRVRNNFDYFEVQMPFLTRGPIVHYEQSAGQGQVSVHANQRTLVWSIGQRFPSKGLELLLQANVKFGVNAESMAVATEDAFSVGNNAYAKVFFKISDYTYSGIAIDTKSTQVIPPVKVKISLVREFLTSEYRVWNAHGDALIACPPPQLPS